MTEISPKIPIEFGALKEALRRGLANNASRYYWWPNLPNVNSSGIIESYPELGVVAERLSTIMAEEMNAAPQTSTGKEKDEIISTSNLIMQVLLRTKLLAKDESALFETVLRIVVSTVKRAEVCCMLAGDLLADRGRWVQILHFMNMHPFPPYHYILFSSFFLCA